MLCKSLCFQFLIVKCFKKATRRKFPQDGKKGKSCCNWEHRGPPEEPRLSITALTVAAPLLPVGVPVTPTPFSLEAGVAKHLYVASGARTLPTQDSPPLSLPVPTHWASLRSSSGPSGGTAARGPGCPASCGTVTPRQEVLRPSLPLWRQRVEQGPGVCGRFPSSISWGLWDPAPCRWGKGAPGLARKDI